MSNSDSDATEGRSSARHWYESTDESRELGRGLALRLPDGVRLRIAQVNRDTDAKALLEAHATRFPEEAQLVERAVPKRILECLAAREMARELFLEMGGQLSGIPQGSMREPLWPAGFVGSIAHSDGMIAVAVAGAHRFRVLGLDLEPNRPLPPDVAAHVSLPGESDEAPASRAVFVVKEAFYKAHCGLHGRFLDFKEARVTWHTDSWTTKELEPPANAIGPTTMTGSVVVTTKWLAAFCAVVR